MAKVKTPILDKLMEQGIIKRDELFPGNPKAGHDYWALAHDGVKVGFGLCWNSRDLKRLEQYLSEHPTPETW